MTKAIPLRRRLKGVMLKYMPGMITCVEFEDFILQYLEGALPEKQKKVFELHLKLCRECRDYLDAYKRSVEMTKVAFESSSEKTILDDVPEDLIKAILDANDTQ